MNYDEERAREEKRKKGRPEVNEVEGGDLPGGFWVAPALSFGAGNRSGAPVFGRISSRPEPAIQFWTLEPLRPAINSPGASASFPVVKSCTIRVSHSW